MRTHIVSVLDASGSMYAMAEDILGGYNDFLVEQRSLALIEDTWSLTVFNDNVVQRLDRSPLSRVPSLTRESYRTRGGTALYDAIGKTLGPYVVDRRLGPAERGIAVIATDGEENVSQTYRLDDVQKIMQALKEAGWTVVYLGVEVRDFGVTSHLRQASRTGFGTENTLTGPRARQLLRDTSKKVALLRRSQLRSTEDLYRLTTPDDPIQLGPLT